MYGETPFGRIKTEKSIKKIKLSNIKDFYKNYSPSVSSLIIVGDIEKEILLPKLDFLRNWKSKEIIIPSNFDFPENKETQIYLLDKEGASQSFIIMGHLADKFDVDGDYFKSQIMNYPLGGGMSGRFFLNLREEKKDGLMVRIQCLWVLIKMVYLLCSLALKQMLQIVL